MHASHTAIDFFNLTTLFPYPVLFSLFHASLDVVVNFLVFRSSFRLESFLSQEMETRVGPWGWPFSCLPNLVSDCRESGDYILSTSLDQFCWDVVDSS